VGKFLVLSLVVLHLLALLFYTLVKRQSLVQSMVTGDKSLDIEVPVASDALPQRLKALVVFAVSALITYGLVNLSL
jgi:hypothetical protein